MKPMLIIGTRPVKPFNVSTGNKHYWAMFKQRVLTQRRFKEEMKETMLLQNETKEESSCMYKVKIFFYSWIVRPLYLSLGMAERVIFTRSQNKSKKG